ncbi:MAG: GDP-L-fucose synthase [Desulfamplus sp.]|nr:GDP-L-fucose synthase [Desulfamplus sp.]
MELNSKIFVAGGSGLVGSAIVGCLNKKGYINILAPPHAELELMDNKAVAEYFSFNKPEYVVLAAAKVGGIIANSKFPADFIYSNLVIQNNIIHQSYLNDVERLIFLGSSCIYPKYSPQPIKEEYLMTGSLEPTNAPYAVAKIAGIEMCWAYNKQYGTRFIPVMPTNLYGSNDNFDLETSHVLPALIRKFHIAMLNGEDSLTIWGTGSPKREFLHSDDLASAVVHLLNIPDNMFSFQNNPLFNIGSGEEVSILELADIIKEIVGFRGKIVLDTSKPDGTPRKLLDTSRIEELGWKATIDLRQGIDNVYRSYEYKLQII